jgi:hypothetical protein
MNEVHVPIHHERHSEYAVITPATARQIVALARDESDVPAQPAPDAQDAPCIYCKESGIIDAIANLNAELATVRERAERAEAERDWVRNEAANLGQRLTKTEEAARHFKAQCDRLAAELAVYREDQATWHD